MTKTKKQLRRQAAARYRTRQLLLHADFKKRKRDPNWRGIFNILIAPLMELKPESWDEREWLYHIMCINARSIEHYKSRSTFIMPGALVLAPGVYDYGIKPEKKVIKRNDVVCVRIDSTEPTVVEIEHITKLTGNIEETMLYRLTDKQYDEIKQNLLLSH